MAPAKNTTVSELQYGDTVIYVQGKLQVTAQVLQSQIVPHLDKDVPGGLRHEEQLIITYLDPAVGKPVMTQNEMDQAYRKVFGVKELIAGGNSGFIRAQVVARQAPKTQPDVVADEETEEKEDPVTA